MGQTVALERVVLDTNVLVCALLFTGTSNRLVPLWQGGKFQLLASSDMIREYARVLSYSKFKLTEEDLRSILEEDVLPFVTPVRVGAFSGVIKEDPSDDKFLACAIRGKADAVVSGDQHLLKLKIFHRIPIMGLRSFLDHF
ncbi:MAG: putative toxin-antitoxin system toxin component, PIN family [Elusimicrobia bacterium]|nr:putative toxin-antitoxin system toxin component, PIN family [Elusimicrobiota bacterium]